METSDDKIDLMFLYILIFLFYCVPLLSFVTYLYSRLLDNNLKLLVRFQVWPYEGKDKVDLLVPPQEGKNFIYCQNLSFGSVTGEFS